MGEYLDPSQMSERDREMMGIEKEEQSVGGDKTNLEDDDRYKKFVEDISLQYLKTKDAEWFYREFSGEVAPSGYLIGHDGNETDVLPSQCISAGFPSVEDQAKEEFKRLYSEGTQSSEQLRSDESGIGELSDKDFMRQYQENGFGWETFTDADKPIIDRWKSIHQEHPEYFTNSSMGKVDVPTRGATEEEIPDRMPIEVLRNSKGQILNPDTNKPVERGSREWWELARRNMLPRNQ